MNEPSGLLIFGIMLGLILLVLATIAALGWCLSQVQTHGLLGLVRLAWGALNPPPALDAPRPRPSPARLQSRPLRSSRGRWSGSRPLPRAGNEGNEPATTLLPGNDGVSASGSEVTSPLPVTSLPDSLPSDVTITVAEAALIAVRLSSGMSPSDVAKSLPGYSPRRNYAEYTAKVRRVKQELEAAQQAEPVQVA